MGGLQGTLSSPQDEGGEPALTLPLSVLLSNSHQHPPSPPRLQGGGSLERRSLLLLKRQLCGGPAPAPHPQPGLGLGKHMRNQQEERHGWPV